MLALHVLQNTPRLNFARDIDHLPGGHLSTYEYPGFVSGPCLNSLLTLACRRSSELKTLTAHFALLTSSPLRRGLHRPRSAVVQCKTMTQTYVQASGFQLLEFYNCFHLLISPLSFPPASCQISRVEIGRETAEVVGGRRTRASGSTACRARTGPRLSRRLRR